MRRNFQYINVVRRPDGTLRSWEEYDTLSRHEWNCERDHRTTPLMSAIIIKDLERAQTIQALDNKTTNGIKRIESRRDTDKGDSIFNRQEFLERSQETEGARDRAPNKEKV